MVGVNDVAHSEGVVQESNLPRETNVVFYHFAYFELGALQSVTTVCKPTGTCIGELL